MQQESETRKSQEQKSQEQQPRETIDEKRARVLRGFGVHAVLNDKRILNFDLIDKRLAETLRLQQSGADAEKKRAIGERMEGMLREWKSRDPVTFHTADGLFALGAELRKIAAETVDDTPEGDMASDISNTLNGAILETVPHWRGRLEVGAVRAAEELGEIETTLLRTNRNANVDAALRKLLSRLRDDVNPDFKDRKRLGDCLMQADVPQLQTYLVYRALRDITSWKTALLDYFLGPKYGPWRRSKTSDT